MQGSNTFRAAAVAGLGLVVAGCASGIVRAPRNADQIMAAVHDGLLEKISQPLPEMPEQPQVTEGSFALDLQLNPNAISPLADMDSAELAVNLDYGMNVRSPEEMALLLDMSVFVKAEGENAGEFQMGGMALLDRENAYIMPRVLQLMAEGESMNLPADAANRWFVQSLSDVMSEDDLEELLESMTQKVDLNTFARSAQKYAVQAAESWYIWEEIGDYEIVDGRYEFEIKSSPHLMRRAGVETLMALQAFTEEAGALAGVTDMDTDDIQQGIDELNALSIEEVQEEFPTIAGTVSINKKDHDDVRVSIYLAEEPAAGQLNVVRDAENAMVTMTALGEDIMQMSMMEDGQFEFVAQDEMRAFGQVNDITIALTVESETGHYDEEYNYINDGLTEQFVLQMDRARNEKVWTGMATMPQEDVQIMFDRVIMDTDARAMDVQFRVMVQGSEAVSGQLLQMERAVSKLDLPQIGQTSPISELEALIEQATGQTVVIEDTMPVDVESGPEVFELRAEVVEMRRRELALIDEMRYDNDPGEIAVSEEIVAEFEVYVMTAGSVELREMKMAQEDQVRGFLQSQLVDATREQMTAAGDIDTDEIDTLIDGVMTQAETLDLDQLEMLTRGRVTASKKAIEQIRANEDPAARAQVIDAIIELNRRHYAIIDEVIYEGDADELAATIELLADRAAELETLTLAQLEQALVSEQEEYEMYLSGLVLEHDSTSDLPGHADLLALQNYVVENYGVNAIEMNAEMP